MDSYKIIDEYIYPYDDLPFEVILDRDIFNYEGKIAEIDGQIFTLCPVMGAHRHDFIGLLPRVDDKSFIGKTMYIYNPDEKNNSK